MRLHWRHGIVVVALSVIVLRGAVAATPMTQQSMPLGTPVFARVQGDGEGVNFSWWAVKGATVGYKLLRAPDPQSTPQTVATLPIGTLGARDEHPAAGAAYYQLVALGAGGARSASAWVLINTPTITSVTAAGDDAVIAWSTQQPAPAGFEIWRTANRLQVPSRVGVAMAGVTRYRDKQAGAGSYHYQVVALGSGNSRAASAWFPSDVPIIAPPATIGPKSNFASMAPSSDSARQKELLQYLVQALQDLGISMTAADEQELADAIAAGGQAGMELASSIVAAISSPDTASQQPCDPAQASTSAQSQADPATTKQPSRPSPQQIDQLIRSPCLQTGGDATLRLRDDILKKLEQIK